MSSKNKGGREIRKPKQDKKAKAAKEVSQVLHSDRSGKPPQPK
jgi:hypothetical protein